MGLGVVFLVFIVSRLILGRHWYWKIAKEFVVGNDLINATENFLDELPDPSNEKKANLIGHLVYRFTRLGIIGLLIAIVPSILLVQQNSLLKSQNKRLDQQTYLQEAGRRSSLVFLFSNVMDAIDSELKDSLHNHRRELSPQLQGRIISLTKALKPYKFMEGDSLIANPLSPERGQLFLNLINSNLNMETLKQILSKSDFSFSDLRGVEIDLNISIGDTLTQPNFKYSDFSNSNFEFNRLVGFNLENCVFKNTKFLDTDFSTSNLKNSFFENVRYEYSSVILADASIEGITLKNCEIYRFWLDSAKFLKDEWIKSLSKENQEYVSLKYKFKEHTYFSGGAPLYHIEMISKDR